MFKVSILFLFAAIRDLARVTAFLLMRLFVGALVFVGLRTGGPSLGWAIGPLLRSVALVSGLPGIAALAHLNR